MKTHIRFLALLLAVVLVGQCFPAIQANAATAQQTIPARYTGDPIQIDGVIDDAIWESAPTFGSSSEGEPGGSIASLWNKDTLYLAIRHTGADSARITVGAKTLTIDLASGTVSSDIGDQITIAAAENSVELAIPFSALEIVIQNYNQKISLEILLSGSNDCAASASYWLSLALYATTKKYALNSTTYNAASGFVFDSSSNTTTLSGNITARSYLGTKASAMPVDHTADNLLLEQTFCIHALPASTPAYVKAGTNASNGYATGFSFILGDRDNNPAGHIAALLCTIHNVDNTLQLCVANADGGTVVDLNRSLGHTFTLGTQWNTNNSVDIYVDHVYVTTVENGTCDLSYTTNDGLMYDYWTTSMDGSVNVSGEVQMSISNATVSQGIYATLSDEIKSEDLLWNVDLDAVSTNIALPSEYTSEYLGDLPITWVSSHTDIITNSGMVTRPSDGDAEVTLTAYVHDTKLWSVQATVLQELAPQSNVVTASHTMTALDLSDGSLSDTAWKYTNHFISNNGSSTGKLGAMWDKDNLYLGITFDNASALTVTANGKSIVVDLENGTSDSAEVAVSANKAEIAIPLSKLSYTITDYSQSMDFHAVLTDANGQSSLSSEDDGELVFVVDSIPLYNLILDGIPYTDGDSRPGAITNVNVADGKAVFEVSDTGDHSVLSKSIDSIIDHSKNLLLEQTLYIETLPVTEAKFYGQASANGYYFYVIDGANNPSGGAGSYGNLVFCTLHNIGDGKLSLVVSGGSATKYQVVDLGVSVGDTFVLGTQWNADDSFTVFVDGELKATVSNVTFGLAYYGKDLIALRYKSQTSESAKITVSNVQLSGAGYTTLAEEITPSAIFGTNIPASLESSLTLPSTFESAYLGTLPLAWTSSNHEVLKDDGTVIRPSGSNDVEVNLTLSVNGNALWTLTPTIKAADTASPTLIPAPFTESVVNIDGSISEEGWKLNSSVLDNGTCVAKFGVQWDLTNLYLAIDTDSIASSKICLNTTTLDLSASNIISASKGTITEIAVPWDVLGLSITDYNQTIAITITNGEGSYTGSIQLTSIDWFATDNPEHRVTNNNGVIGGNGSQGVQQLENGYYIYDHYSANATNAGSVRTYFAYKFVKGDTATGTIPLWPIDQTYFCEFDFQANSMPVYTTAVAGFDIRFACYGICWSISNHRDGNDSNLPSDVTICGIYNSADGLVFVVSGNESLQILPLNKQLGDLFRIGHAVDPDGNLTIFIDGEKFAYIPNAEKRISGLTTSDASGLIMFNAYRSKDAATSKSDNIDAYITNFSMGLYYGEELFDSLTFDSICGENTDANGITSNLILPDTLSNSQLSTPHAITWSSSDPEIIGIDGTVTQPEHGGKLVTLTATANGKTKDFTLYVKGKTAADSILVVSNDTAPYKTAGESLDVYNFTLDENNKSIIYNLGAAQKINVVKLTDGDDTARLSTEVLKLYVSNDNQSYTQISDFKLLHDGRNWYLYDFEATAQYVKVHCTHYDGTEADFTGVLSEMITAYYEETFGANDATFAESTTYQITNNSGTAQTDAPWKIPASGLNVTFLAENKADARFYLNGELLYHYFDGTNFYVRIPAISAGSSVTITVKAGNASAMDISNKEYVYEITYGTREVVVANRLAKILALPNGTVISMDCNDSGTALVRRFSYDGGQSWTDYEEIECTRGWIHNASGYIYDSLTGRIMFQGYATDSTPYPTRMIYSDDNGVTWFRGAEIGPIGFNYTDGIELSTNDGAGPNVDFVLSLCSTDSESGLNMASVVYSTDGGTTWQESKSKIYISDAGSGIEAGISESALYELEDGTIVMIARCQKENGNNFAITYSNDHGITWQESPDMTDIYTVNTQPVLHDYRNTPFLVWSSNNVLGGTSYRRTPLNIAYSIDNMKTFRNILDLYSKYSLQGLDTATQNQATNPNFTFTKDDLLVTWFNNFQEVLYMRVENFEDYFFKTKGAYDSFEGATVKYEGWSTIYGTASVSTAQASEGNKSMLIAKDTATARSIPYFQNGTISMDVYLDNPSANFNIYFQSAFSNDTTATPLILNCANGSMEGVSLKTGWNTIVLNCKLADGSATVSINGSFAKSMTVDTEIGDYICYIRISTDATTALYLDDFTVMDNKSLDILNEKANDTISGFEVSNITGNAVVTSPASGWVKGTNTFTVTSENACVVMISNDNGATYTVLRATKAEAENTYSFTAENVTATSKIVVALKGDANGDGKLTVADRIALNRSLLDESNDAYVALDAVETYACDFNGDGKITVTDRIALNRALLDEADEAYLAPSWDN